MTGETGLTTLLRVPGTGAPAAALGAAPPSAGGASGLAGRPSAGGALSHGPGGSGAAGGSGTRSGTLSQADLARWEARLAILLVQEQLGQLQLTMANELQDARDALNAEHAAREAAMQRDVAALEQEVARLRESGAAAGGQIATRSPISPRSRSSRGAEGRGDVGSSSTLQSVNGGNSWRQGGSQRAVSRELRLSSGAGDAAEAAGATTTAGEGSGPGGAGDGAESLREQHLLRQLRDAQEMLQARGDTRNGSNRSNRGNRSNRSNRSDRVEMRQARAPRSARAHPT